MTSRKMIAALACLVLMTASEVLAGQASQLSVSDPTTWEGDALDNPGPLATDLSVELKPAAIQAAMRKVADWQSARITDELSRRWTFAALYIGMLSASETLKEPRYHDQVLKVAEHYQWTLGPRKTHADDQAIGQSYLWLFAESPAPERIQPLQKQFDELMQSTDDPAKPVWWWCDALFMAPPVWTSLAKVTHDSGYIDYMDHEWHVASNLLWDPQEQLFFRDRGYFDKREKNGRKVFWSRGNGWVMAGLARVLQDLPANDPRRPFYIERLRVMAKTIVQLQGADGLWRAGLLDAADYPYPEVSGSAFFVYALAWGINHQVLDAREYGPAVQRGWAGLISHIYADGRLGCIQQGGGAPALFPQGASYVYGVGAFLLAGSEVNRWAEHDAGSVPNLHRAAPHSRSAASADPGAASGLR